MLPTCTVLVVLQLTLTLDYELYTYDIVSNIACVKIELKRIVNLLSGYPDHNSLQISYGYWIVMSSNLYFTTILLNYNLISSANKVQ